MSTESLNKTSITENYISKKTPKKVNIDVLKQRVFLQEKKEKIYARILLLSLFTCVCTIGFLISF